MIKNPIVRLAWFGPVHFLKFIIKGRFNSPRTLIVEISGKCNLNCRHCYWRGRTKPELPDREWERRMKAVVRKYPGITRALWIGGEPMLRFELIKKLSRYFLFNTVITNGTFPLKKAEGICYSVSVDGTEPYHRQSKGGNYQMIKRNVEHSRANVVLNFLISQKNKSNLEDYVAEWAKVKNVSRFNFSFYTPNHGEEDAAGPGWLNYSERDGVIRRIERLQKKYPDRLKKILIGLKRMQKIGYARSGNICRRSGPLYLDSQGRELFRIDKGKKYRCFHPEADCAQCGHHVLIRAAHRYRNRRTVMGEFLLDCRRFFTS